VSWDGKRWVADPEQQYRWQVSWPEPAAPPVTQPKPSVYLAGQMGGLTWREACEWREEVTAALRSSYEILSPMTGQYDPARADELIDFGGRRETDDLPIGLVPSAYVTQDLFYIDRAQFVLANFKSHARVSIGTLTEWGYGLGQGKHLIGVVERGGVYDHAWIRRTASVMPYTMADAIEYLRGIAPR
jgi:nucleoside 2-deoxyribosyltransferase